MSIQSTFQHWIKPIQRYFCWPSTTSAATNTSRVVWTSATIHDESRDPSVPRSTQYAALNGRNRTPCSSSSSRNDVYAWTARTNASSLRNATTWISTIWRWSWRHATPSTTKPHGWSRTTTTNAPHESWPTTGWNDVNADATHGTWRRTFIKES